MLRVAVKMVLIFILAYTGVKIWYNRLEDTMLSSLPAEKTVATRSTEKKVEIRHKSDDYRIIVERNVFGAVLDKIEEEKILPPVEELQPTKLKLSLMGTVYGDKRDSRAIISDETNRKQDIYAVGDTIQGALIKAIERRRVVLQVNGKDEFLNIKEREGGPVDPRALAPPEHGERKSLRDRLNMRKPTVRPSRPNRSRPAVKSTRNGEVNGNQIPDQETEQLEEVDAANQEQPEEPDFMEGQPL